MKKLLMSALMAAACASASAADFQVYSNGTMCEGASLNPWWNVEQTLTAENPSGEGKVWSLAPMAENSGNFCGGIQTVSGSNVPGTLAKANVSFKYYATTPCHIVFQIDAGGVVEKQAFDVTETAVNQWKTVSYSVVDAFPAVSNAWLNYEGEGVADLIGIIVEQYTMESKVYIDDVIYTNIDESWTKPAQQYAPEPPVPTHDAQSVISLFSNAYTPAVSFSTSNGGWGESTQYSTRTSESGATVAYISNFNYLGWQYPNIDVTSCNMMHVDFYAETATPFGFTPISPGAEKPYIAPEVKVGEWNSYDVPLSHWDNVDFSNLFQIKFDQGNGGKGYIANVYFYHDDNIVEPTWEYGAKWYGNVTGTYHVGGEYQKDFYVDMDYVFTANEDGTLGFEVEFNEGADLPAAVFQAHVVKNGGDEWVHFTKDGDIATGKSTLIFNLKEAIPTIEINFPYAEGLLQHFVNDYVFGASNEAPEKTPRLTLSAEACNISFTTAEIAYTLRATSHFDGVPVTILLNGEAAEGNPVVLSDLNESTGYTYTLKAVATIDNVDYESNEVEVSFKTPSSTFVPSHWYGIADGYINNAYYVGEDESMRRQLPVSISVEVVYNEDKSLTASASISSAKEIVGIVAPNIVLVSDPRHNPEAGQPGQPDHTPMQGTWKEATYTTGANLYDEGDRMAYFTFDVVYNGGSTNIAFSGDAYHVGDSNDLVVVGEPAALEFAVPVQNFMVGQTEVYAVVARDAANHFVFDADINVSTSAENFVVEGYTITALALGEATITATCGELKGETKVICYRSADSKDLEGVDFYTNEYVDDASRVFDGNEGTIAVWNCAATEEHFLVYDLGALRNIHAVEIVWEGAMAVEYTVTLSEAPVIYKSNGSMRAAAFDDAGNYVFNITDGANTGATIRRIHTVDTGYGHDAQYITLQTSKAVNKDWGIKVRQMNVYGLEQPSGVHSVAVDSVDGEVEYFNLQGARVQGDLTPGIYIRRQGNTASKVLVK
ncbi:MAG: hypothetical protein NC405_07475 [Odoribacter sp.]|nr:hypothetical protein [Odoribacter sp.]